MISIKDIDMADIVGMNDYEMLQTVKYGYAMANAMPPVKEVAYQVIDSNENDGVILKIKEILKGKC